MTNIPLHRLSRLTTALIVLPLLCLATIHYVNIHASTEGDGSSWSQPCRSLQKMIDKAHPEDEIWIAAGVYFPENVHEINGETALASSFELKDGVSLRGGFAGTETTPEERKRRVGAIYAWEYAAETILRQGADRCGSVLIAQNISHNTCLDGLHIEHGHASGSGEDGYGGGLRGSGSLTVTNCLFRHNTARNGGGLHWRGSLRLMSSGLISNRLITTHHDGIGGGAAIIGDNAVLCGIICADNDSNLSGGGLWLAGQTTAAYCTIVGNRSSRRASGVQLEDNTILLNSIVWNNTGNACQIAVSPVASVHHCAIPAAETTLAPARHNVPLVSVKDTPLADAHLPHFAAPSHHDFRLLPNSCCLRRASPDFHTPNARDAMGQPLSAIPPDIGACQAPAVPAFPVCDIILEEPCIYGESSRLTVHEILPHPVPLSIVLTVDNALADIRPLTPRSWLLHWKQAGPVPLTVTITAAAWLPQVINLTPQVAPRPLVIAANDGEYYPEDPPPKLTWELAAGHLVGTDTITGNLECHYQNARTPTVPITQGTLNVNDGHSGQNYKICFYPGELIIIH